MFRMGMLAALRSRAMKSQTIGVMITASHNPAADNGVKIVDPMGEMLEEKWEEYAENLANAASHEELADTFESICKRLNGDPSNSAHVIIARDTRPSGESLVRAVADGVVAATGNDKSFTDAKLMTTPQLHYLTRCTNDASYGEPTEQGYYKKLATAYLDLVKNLPPMRLVVDCANGVGAIKLKQIADLLRPALELTLANVDTKNSAALNSRCGADFVKTTMCAPDGLTDLATGSLDQNVLYASIDGDADRIVFFLKKDSTTSDCGQKDILLLDGDRIAILVADYLNKAKCDSNINLGVVQTAYANGASTAYLQEKLRVPVSFACTGVKNLHAKAMELDAGVYFEANGHGTVIFNTKAARDLYAGLIPVINETVGDAISDMLLVCAILAKTGAVTLADAARSSWAELYNDLPSRLVRVQVANRASFRTIDADRRLDSPSNLQNFIDAQVQKIGPKSRAFVRPSGTEDVVRVYAEAATHEQCDILAYTVAGAVFDQAGGVGARPKEFL